MGRVTLDAALGWKQSRPWLALVNRQQKWTAKRGDLSLCSSPENGKPGKLKWRNKLDVINIHLIAS